MDYTPLAVVSTTSMMHRRVPASLIAAKARINLTTAAAAAAAAAAASSKVRLAVSAFDSGPCSVKKTETVRLVTSAIRAGRAGATRLVPHLQPELRRTLRVRCGRGLPVIAATRTNLAA